MNLKGNYLSGHKLVTKGSWTRLTLAAPKGHGQECYLHVPLSLLDQPWERTIKFSDFSVNN